MRRWFIVLPSAITILSIVLRVCFLMDHLGALYGFAGTALDAVDGWVARRLGVATKFGADLDWYGDVACAAMAAGEIGRKSAIVTVEVTVALVLLWTIRRSLPRRISGSAFLIAVVAIERL